LEYFPNEENDDLFRLFHGEPTIRPSYPPIGFLGISSMRGKGDAIQRQLNPARRLSDGSDKAWACSQALYEDLGSRLLALARGIEGMLGVV
jgi:hypothetical protein